MLTNLAVLFTIEAGARPAGLPEPLRADGLTQEIGRMFQGGWNLEKLQAVWSKFLAALLGFLPHLLSACVIVAIGFAAVKIIPRPIKSMLKKTRLDDVAVVYILRALKIFIWALVVMMALDAIGVPVTSLLTVFAAVGAAVALAIKDNLANLASGIVLLFTKPFKAGDYIEVEDVSGTIREIEIMHTSLDTPGNMLVAIPNTKMMTATIINYSAHDTRRQDLVFSISYEDDLHTAMEVLQKLADEHPLVLKEPEPPLVRVKEQASSSVNLLLRVWSANADYWELQFDLQEKVKLAFDANGITIPYEQLDVHQK